jgi:RNA recognition motif-containing protein
MNIYVGNLSFDISGAQLQAEFEAFGAVSKVSIVADRDTGRPRGFAFVEMEDSTQASAAIGALNGKQVSGRALSVSEARPRTGGGGGGGGYGRRDR